MVVVVVDAQLELIVLDSACSLASDSFWSLATLRLLLLSPLPHPMTTMTTTMLSSYGSPTIASMGFVLVFFDELEFSASVDSICLEIIK